jgi:hypothetical protein
MKLEEIKSLYRNEILNIARKNNVEDVKIFGSTANGYSSENSDIDFLIKLKPEASGWDIGGFYSDVSELLGRKIDVVTEKSLHPYLKKIILSEAVNL